MTDRGLFLLIVSAFLFFDLLICWWGVKKVAWQMAIKNSILFTESHSVSQDPLKSVLDIAARFYE